jgi:hypothetical protein
MVISILFGCKQQPKPSFCFAGRKDRHHYFLAGLPGIVCAGILEKFIAYSVAGAYYVHVPVTGMSASNWKWFFVWFGIGLVVYFMYGYRKSKLVGSPA